MITVKRFRRIERAVREAGFGDSIEWSEAIQAPTNADEFAERAIYVICNSGLSNRVAGPVFERCMSALRRGDSSSTQFGHAKKTAAIDEIWQHREALFQRFKSSAYPLHVLAELPHIGPVTVHHLAKNFGTDTAKPDVHLERLAKRDKTTCLRMCQRLAGATGYRVATIDSILWRACEQGILDSRVYEREGWRAAFHAKLQRR